MSLNTRIFVLSCVGFLTSPSCQAFTNTSWIVDGGGVSFANASYQGVSAFAQGVPVGSTESSTYLNYSGFLHTFTWHPELDTDRDGVADENDRDDDNDTISDLIELAGVRFNPNTVTDPRDADSDDDGASDGDEGWAGTNPLDPNHVLKIINISIAKNGHVLIEWQSRAQHSYELIQAFEVDGIPDSPMTVDTLTASGGVGPWRETISWSLQPATERRTYYQVRLAP